MKTFVYLAIIIRTAYGLNVLQTDRKTEERSISKEKSQSDKIESDKSDFQHKLDKVYHAIKGTNGKERRGFFGHPEISLKFEFPANDEPKHKRHRSTSLELSSLSSSSDLLSSEIDSRERFKEEKKKYKEMKKKYKEQKKKDKDQWKNHREQWEKHREQWKKDKKQWIKEKEEKKQRRSSHIIIWVTEDPKYTWTWPTGGNWPSGILDWPSWSKYWATVTGPMPTELVGWSKHWATASDPWLTGGTFPNEKKYHSPWPTGSYGGPKPTKSLWASKNTRPSWASHNTNGITKGVGAVNPE